MALGVHSEVGRLRKVMIHRPGLEHTRLTPSNAEELLFDDVLWVKKAKDEHDAFAEVMRERGVEVTTPNTCSPRRSSSPRPRTGLVITSSTSEVGIARRAGPRVGADGRRDAGRRVLDRRDQGPMSPGTSGSSGSRPTRSMLLPPLPNFLFQRDPSCWIYDGVTLNPMTNPRGSRKR